MILPDPAGSLAGRAALAASTLAPLRDSLAADLDDLLPDESFFVPAEKAAMSRWGGRCRRDGLPLAFDPRTPAHHRCPACGAEYDTDADYRWWVMGYQLWLAERAVHAALLWRLDGPDRYRGLAEAILVRLAERYPQYPNADNVLGPTRPFFSTYLESIWLLQLAVALDLLEGGGAGGAGGTVRDRLVEPSSRLIASFNEGGSNRQVWNAAALAAAGALLGRDELQDRAFHGPGGLMEHLRDGLLEDGTWYEGENYHLFAHRGLWYLVQLAEHAGARLPETLVRRFERAFAAPLRTSLPDLTFPARRDAPYRVSLRQWRVAESLELGFARAPDEPLLAAGLRAVYGDAPAGDPGRWCSTAEAERNHPGVRLTRADLGWKALLYARAEGPGSGPSAVTESVLLPSQGLAVIRREEGRVYAALDYGHHGGGHGHPDRLNLWLVDGDTRILEDVGTGSYVDPSLPWYRSTLAHNAPLVDGRSQVPASGVLRAWDERDGFGWIDAEVVPGPEVLVRRTVVVADGYLVDRVAWSAAREVTLDLPWHVDGEVEGARWSAAALEGALAPEDGFPFTGDAERADGPAASSMKTAGTAQARVHIPGEHEWWRARAPGPPGEPHRRFLLARCRGRRGEITSVWTWAPGWLRTVLDGQTLTVQRPGGVRDVHQREGPVWIVETAAGRTIRLAGVGAGPVMAAPQDGSPSTVAAAPLTLAATGDQPPPIGELTRGGPSAPMAPTLRFELGAEHYRRSEASWAEAGSPRASVVLAATGTELVVEVTVLKTPLAFAPARAENPLDNEHPDVNSDGIQLHVAGLAGMGTPGASWILVPEPGGAGVRISTTARSPQPPVAAMWRPVDGGYQVQACVELAGLPQRPVDLSIDVIVNETAPGRERRRGQLVLSGARGEWVYLRGDRQDADRLVPIRVRHG